MPAPFLCYGSQARDRDGEARGRPMFQGFELLSYFSASCVSYFCAREIMLFISSITWGASVSIEMPFTNASTIGQFRTPCPV